MYLCTILESEIFNHWMRSFPCRIYNRGLILLQLLPSKAYL